MLVDQPYEIGGVTQGLLMKLWEGISLSISSSASSPRGVSMDIIDSGRWKVVFRIVNLVGIVRRHHRLGVTLSARFTGVVISAEVINLMILDQPGPVIFLTSSSPPSPPPPFLGMHPCSYEEATELDHRSRKA